MTRKTGHVQITNNGLAAKCDKCRKAISYPIGSRMTTAAFDVLLREFTAKHKRCGHTETAEEKEER
jgi:hypothetical protein